MSITSKLRKLINLLRKESELRFVVANSSGGSNIGDEAIMKGLVTQIEKGFNDVEIVSFCGDPDRVSELYKIKAFKMSFNVKGLIIFLLSLLNADLFILGGGGFFQDYGKDWMRKRAIEHRLWLIRIAKLLRRKVAVLGVGVGPLQLIKSKEQIKAVLNKVDLISVRDKDSKELLLQCGVKENKIFEAADFAFTLAHVDQTRTNLKFTNKLRGKNKLNIGISVRPLYTAVKDKKTKDQKIAAQLAKVCDVLVEKCKANLILIPMDIKQDTPFLEEIFNRTRGRNRSNMVVVKEMTTVEETKQLFSCLDLMIGARYHSLIFSIIENVPYIAVNYHPKVESLTKLFSWKYVVALNEVSPSNIIPWVENVVDKRNRLKKEIAENYKILNKKSWDNTRLLKNYFRELV